MHCKDIDQPHRCRISKSLCVTVLIAKDTRLLNEESFCPDAQSDQSSLFAHVRRNNLLHGDFSVLSLAHIVMKTVLKHSSSY